MATNGAGSTAPVEGGAEGPSGWPLCAELDDLIAAEPRLTRAFRDVYRVLLRHAFHAPPARRGSNFEIVGQLVRAGQVAARLSYRTLAKLARCSLSTVQRALAALQKLGLIRPMKTRTRTVGVYAVGELTQGGRRFFASPVTFSLGPYGGPIEPADATPPRAPSPEVLEVLSLANALHEEHLGVAGFHRVDEVLTLHIEATLERVGLQKLQAALRGAWLDGWLVQQGLAGPHYLCSETPASKRHLDGAAARWSAGQAQERRRAADAKMRTTGPRRRRPHAPKPGSSGGPPAHLDDSAPGAEAAARWAKAQAEVRSFRKRAERDPEARDQLETLESKVRDQLGTGPPALPAGCPAELVQVIARQHRRTAVDRLILEMLADPLPPG